jgi:DNA replication protein DnaC
VNTGGGALEAATIRQQCKLLRMPTIGAQCTQLAEQAVRERRTHLGYLEALLQAELEEREQRLIARRIREAHLPRMKTLDEFDFARNHKVSAQHIHELADGGYIGRAEPVIFIGDSGTGKTHLLPGLAVAACGQKRRVRFATAAAMINELVEAKHQLQLGRALARWARYDLIALDEVGYVPLAEVGAEFLFQVIAERAEKAAVIVTTNLPFSEWTQVVPNPRLCKGLARPHYRSCAYHRDRNRVLSLPSNFRKAQGPKLGGELKYRASANRRPRKKGYVNSDDALFFGEELNNAAKSGGPNLSITSGPRRSIKIKPSFEILYSDFVLYLGLLNCD